MAQLGSNGVLYNYQAVPTSDSGTSKFSAKAAMSEDPCGTAYAYNVIDPEIYNAEIAAGKAMCLLQKTARGHVNIEAASIYGVAVALPQFARTAGYSMYYVGLVVRAYIFLGLNIVLQGFILYMMSKEERVMSKYAGQMHLCDFGAHIGNCPGAPNCLGPGGTAYTPPRLYPFDLWSTRVYVRDALRVLFPERAEEIDANVDPGEYGLESYYLRVLSCMLFVMGCWNEMASINNMYTLLRHIPTEDQPWICYELPQWTDNKEQAKAMMGWTELDLVKFKIRGMPLGWKVVNYVFVLFPKCYLFFLTLDVGVVFLLETAVIEDMIINAVALAFILALDEMMCSCLVSPVSLYMCGKLEPFDLVDESAEENWTDKECFDKQQRDKDYHWYSAKLWHFIFPQRLVTISLTTLFFVIKYYWEHCEQGEDGGIVSKTIFAPKSIDFSVLSFLCGPFPNFFQVDTTNTVLWTMPDHD
jgi:hypothetical protein